MLLCCVEPLYHKRYRLAVMHASRLDSRLTGGSKLAAAAKLAPKSRPVSGSSGKMGHGLMRTQLTRMSWILMWMCPMKKRTEQTGAGLTTLAMSHGVLLHRDLPGIT